MRKLVILYCLFFFSIQLFGQQKDSNLSIIDKITNYYKKVPQEKIYIQTDKSLYCPGDSVWFRGYLVDALTGMPSNQSLYMFVELRKLETDSLVERAMIMCDSTNVFSNSLALSTKIPEGEYSLSAYTEWMRNFDSDLFFSKTIHIFNPLRPHKAASSNTRHLTSFDLSLMPEGGNLLSGVHQRVAYKAVGNDGYGVDVYIRLVNEEGDVITEASSEHLGMGTFEVTAKANEPLYIEAHSKDGLSKRVALPAPLSDGVSLSVSSYKGYLLVRPMLTANIAPDRLALIIHGGKNLYARETIQRSDTLISYPKTRLAEGIVSISLTDKQTNEVLAERMVYIRGNGAAKVTVETDKKAYKDRMPVKLSLAVKDEKGNPLAGRYSIAVTDERSVPANSIQPHIDSYLLLSSDIKGYVEQPNFYFQPVTPEVDHKLDLLMLTQGWRRYDLSKMLRSEYPEITHSFQRYQSISGTVKSSIGQTVKGGKLIFFMPGTGQQQTLQLGDSSKFCITDLHFMNGTQFTLQATNKKGYSKYMNLTLDPETFPTFKPNLLPTKQTINEQPGNGRVYTRSEARVRYINGSKLIELPDVEVTAKRVPPPVQNVYKISPDRALTEGSIALKTSSTIDVLIQKLGLRVGTAEGLKCILPIRENKSAPIIYVDNFRLNSSDELWSFPATDVKQMEVIMPGNAGGLTYGADVLINGAVMVFLKDGSESIKEKTIPASMKNICPLGYKEAVEFYSPCYNTSSPKNYIPNDMRTTIFWSPNVLVDESGAATVDFFMPDKPGNYRIIIEGVSDTGKLIREEVVKKNKAME